MRRSDLFGIAGAAVAAVSAMVAAAIAAVKLRRRAPKGSGTFVRNLKADGRPTPSQFADRAKELGLSWVALLGETFNDGMATGVYDAELPEYAAELRRRGVEVWVWGWPKPEDQVRFVEDLARQVKRTKAAGVIIDAEGPYVGDSDSKRAAARALGRAFKDRRIAFGVTSFGGGPDFFGAKAFPWGEFSEHAAFGMPQIYDPPTGERARAWLQSWEEDATFPELVVILDANNSPEVMRMWWEQLGRPRDVGWWTNDYVEGNTKKEAVVRSIAKGAALA